MDGPLSVTATAAVDSHKLNHIPTATYRLQLRTGFGLKQVQELIPYLHRLGISDLYLSPLFQSREQSSHGYDVVDHRRIEPDFGDYADFESMAAEARDHGMGLLLDVVPNHMGINDPGNTWWLDVLENGETSRYASYFDIDWDPPSRNLKHTVLLPLLGDQFGTELEGQRLQLLYQDGRLQVSYYDQRFPVAPPTWPCVLSVALDRLSEAVKEEQRIELLSIITQLRHLPPGHLVDEQSTQERYREQRVARKRLATLVEQSELVRQALDAAINEFNGTPGVAKSFDQFERLLDRQWYRLAFWRVASDEINYRRFFDINELAAIRVEDPRVFEATHALVYRLLEAGWVTGLRIDHPDGLLDPQQYFQDLQSLYRRSQQTASDETPQLYVVAEKILSYDEQLSSDWPVAGTTGYEFMNVVNRLLVDPAGVEAIRRDYGRLTDVRDTPADVLYHSKKTILYDSMSSEVHVLASHLYRIAQQHRSSRDFTYPTILRALREIIACFAVYRTYTPARGWEVSAEDYRRITAAVRLAKRRNPTLIWALFNFVSSVLLLENPPSLTPEEAEERRRFVLKLQQVSGPVMAKGVEDTAFYRYYPLASLNEVGGELDAEPLEADEFHRLMRHRLQQWPHSLSASATHDTKRGEGTRTRINVLSETPAEWTQRVLRWQDLNLPRLRSLDGQDVPDRNEQYLLYQTLVGTWPLAPMRDTEREAYIDRIIKYLEKALREAKIHTSWTNPSTEYEEAVFDFVRDILHPEWQEFQQDLSALVHEIAPAGFINSLTQTVLKCTLPGVPDIYQGTELWDFSLVDPDNRRPVDFTMRERMCRDLDERFADNPAQLLTDLADAWPDPQVKMFVLSRALRLRAAQPDLFAHGDYLPLPVAGEWKDHALAFARRWGETWLLVVVPLRVHRLRQMAVTSRLPILPIDWGDTRVELPDELPGRWTDEFTGAQFVSSAAAPTGAPQLELAQLFRSLPLAVLTSQREMER